MRQSHIYNTLGPLLLHFDLNHPDHRSTKSSDGELTREGSQTATKLGVGVQGTLPTIDFSSFLTTMTAGPAMMGGPFSVCIAACGLVIGSQEVLCRSAPSPANNPSGIDDLDLECEQRSRISIQEVNSRRRS